MERITQNMIFSKERLQGRKGVKVGDYKPYRNLDGGVNPDFDDFSSQILALKRGEQSAIEYFQKKIEPVINTGITIVTIPSSDPDKKDSGTIKLAKKLCENDRVDGTEVLIRTNKIEKLAEGGNRDKSVHLESIEVRNTELIVGKYVLLIDDVSTTFNSINACKKLLNTYIPRKIETLVLGITKR